LHAPVLRVALIIAGRGLREHSFDPAHGIPAARGAEVIGEVVLWLPGHYSSSLSTPTGTDCFTPDSRDRSPKFWKSFFSFSSAVVIAIRSLDLSSGVAPNLATRIRSSAAASAPPRQYPERTIGP